MGSESLDPDLFRCLLDNGPRRLCRSATRLRSSRFYGRDAVISRPAKRACGKERKDDAIPFSLELQAILHSEELFGLLACQPVRLLMFKD